MQLIARDLGFHGVFDHAVVLDQGLAFKEGIRVTI